MHGSKGGRWGGLTTKTSGLPHRGPISLVIVTGQFVALYVRIWPKCGLTAVEWLGTVEADLDSGIREQAV
jgi:hypothetical protein